MSRKAHAEEGHANNERWLLTYADLITLLLVFFVVMYSISKADERKFARISASLSKAFNTVVLQGSDQTTLGGELGPEGGNSLLEDVIGLRAQIVKLAEGMDIPGRVDLVQEKDGVALSLSASLLFDSGRADLAPESTKILDAVADWLRSVPNEVRVEGHTDNIPVESDLYPTNWELSVARATVVTRYIVEVGRIAPQRLSAQGYGEYRPIADNYSRESRALNRRVMIVILNLNPPEEAPK
ncbi:MAG: OmpA family protein [Chloroflexi bacterium]|nr:OmpA family protein [Chloroflexota bacterium]